MTNSFKLEAFKSKSRWYWRIRAKNSKIIADGSEGYRTVTGLKRAINKLPLDWSLVDMVTLR